MPPPAPLKDITEKLSRQSIFVALNGCCAPGTDAAIRVGATQGGSPAPQTQTIERNDLHGISLGL
jgi:hypothetical protein